MPSRSPRSRSSRCDCGIWSRRATRALERRVRKHSEASERAAGRSEYRRCPFALDDSCAARRTRARRRRARRPLKPLTMSAPSGVDEPLQRGRVTLAGRAPVRLARHDVGRRRHRRTRQVGLRRRRRRSPTPLRAMFSRAFSQRVGVVVERRPRRRRRASRRDARARRSPVPDVDRRVRPASSSSCSSARHSRVVS